MTHEANAKFLVDTSLLAWHIDQITGMAYNLPHDSSPVKKWRALNPEIEKRTSRTIAGP